MGWRKILVVVTFQDLVTWLLLFVQEAGERGLLSRLPCAAKTQGFVSTEEREQVLRTASSLYHMFIVLEGGGGSGLCCSISFSLCVFSLDYF